MLSIMLCILSAICVTVSCMHTLILIGMENKGGDLFMCNTNVAVNSNCSLSILLYV